jgi:hypothetical protein
MKRHVAERMKRRTRTRHALWVLIGTLLIGAVLPWTALYAEFARRPELAIRSRRLHTHAGSVLAEQPIGQAFHCRRDGLRRIDVRFLAPRGVDAEPISLSVRLDEAGAEVARVAEAKPSGGQWAEFEFAPIEGSGGRTVYFELAPAIGTGESTGEGSGDGQLKPWIRFRGQLGARRPSGPETLTDTTITFEVESEMHGLSALALQYKRIAPEAEIDLALFEHGADEPLRRARLTGRALHEGFAFLTFDPIDNSYARTYRAELSVPSDVTVRARDGEPAWLAYHGAHTVDSALVGMTVGGAASDTQDLVFRAWSRPSTAAMLYLLFERLGTPLTLAGLAWLAFVALVLHFALARR